MDTRPFFSDFSNGPGYEARMGENATTRWTGKPTKDNLVGLCIPLQLLTSQMSDKHTHHLWFHLPSSNVNSMLAMLWWKTTYLSISRLNKCSKSHNCLSKKCDPDTLKLARKSNYSAHSQQTHTLQWRLKGCYVNSYSLVAIPGVLVQTWHHSLLFYYPQGWHASPASTK